MDRNLLLAGAFFGASGIILGAFGAHALKEILTVQQLQMFETGVRYQMYHAFLLLLVGMYPKMSAKAKRAVLWLVVSGVFVFSGSIYLLATSAVESFNKIVGPVTPIGGTLLIVGWFVVLVDFFRQKS